MEGADTKCNLEETETDQQFAAVGIQPIPVVFRNIRLRQAHAVVSIHRDFSQHERDGHDQNQRADTHLNVWNWQQGAILQYVVMPEIQIDMSSYGAYVPVISTLPVHLVPCDFRRSVVRNNSGVPQGLKIFPVREEAEVLAENTGGQHECYHNHSCVEGPLEA